MLHDQIIDGSNVTVQELINAFCDVLDGVKDHDIESQFGFGKDAADRIIDIRSQLRFIWKYDDGKNVITF